MNTKNCVHTEKNTGLNDYRRVIHELRIAATGQCQSEGQRKRIRAATQC